MKKIMFICVAALGLAGCNSTGYYYDNGYNRDIVYTVPRAPLVVPPRSYFPPPPRYYQSYNHRAPIYNHGPRCYTRPVMTHYGMRHERICR
jgi:hypothetical protein